MRLSAAQIVFAATTARTAARLTLQAPAIAQTVTAKTTRKAPIPRMTPASRPSGLARKGPAAPGPGRLPSLRSSR